MCRNGVAPHICQNYQGVVGVAYLLFCCLQVCFLLVVQRVPRKWALHSKSYTMHTVGLLIAYTSHTVSNTYTMHNTGPILACLLRTVQCMVCLLLTKPASYHVATRSSYCLHYMCALPIIQAAANSLYCTNALPLIHLYRCGFKSHMRALCSLAGVCFLHKQRFACLLGK